MKIKELLDELKEKEDYKKFMSENVDAFFCSAMFVLGEGLAARGMSSKEGTEVPLSSDKIDLNFFLPSKNRLSSFSMPFGTLTNHVEEIVGQKEITDLDFKVDACDLMEATGGKFKKIIGVLHGGKWNLTCLNGMDMSRMVIDAYSGEKEEKENGSLMDMVRVNKGKK